MSDVVSSHPSRPTVGIAEPARRHDAILATCRAEPVHNAAGGVTATVEFTLLLMLVMCVRYNTVHGPLLAVDWW